MYTIEITTTSVAYNEILYRTSKTLGHEPIWLERDIDYNELY